MNPPPIPMAALLTAVLATWLLSTPTRAGQPGTAFPTPEQAVAALDTAVSRGTPDGFHALFGAAAQDLVNPDQVQGATEFADFRAAFQTAHRLVSIGENRRLLEIGRGAWPFPIPIEKQADGWRFNTAAGLEELLNRRIGRNELDVLRILRASVEAQREYASRDLDAMACANSPNLSPAVQEPPTDFIGPPRSTAR